MSDRQSETSAPGETYSSWYHVHHISGFWQCAFSAIIMTTWPWIFFGVLKRVGGIRLDRTSTRIIHENPKDTAFFVTVICVIISFLLGLLHAKVVAKIAQKRIVLEHTTLSHISFFSALKDHKFSRPVLSQVRPWILLLTLGLYFGVFFLATPAFTTLLTPAPFNRNISLTGTELDFASNNTNCINWFNDNIISDTCDWIPYNGSWYTDCLEENQLLDVLEAGRGNMLSLHSNNTLSLTFTQLGGVDGLHLLGSLRGVLPIGPNGVPSFNTVPASSFKDAMAAPDLFYNYTLELQGIYNNVTCAYTYNPASIPIEYLFPYPPPGGLWQYNGTCLPGQDILSPALYLVPPSNNSLAFWACQTGGDSYTLYFYGSGGYQAGIGNITCSVAPFQPALFPLTYSGRSGMFAVQNAVSTSPNTSTELLTRAIKSLGSNIYEAQGLESNLLAESIISFGVKFFGLQPYAQDETYLRLYEAMIQGILDYEAAYIRLIYSTKVNASTPRSCIRQVNGRAQIQVFGWYASRKIALYLIPITFINLSILVFLVVAWCIADENGQKRFPLVDPTDPMTLMLSGDASGQWLQDGTFPPIDPKVSKVSKIPEIFKFPKVTEVWNNEVAFGRNKGGIHRFWPSNEVVGP